MSEEKELDVNIETTSQELVSAVKHGVENESLEMGAIIKWSALGVAVVAVFIVVLMFVGKDAFNNATANAGATSTYKKVDDLNREAETILSSYGVVDAEEGIYRIPIDEAINKIAVD